MEAEAESGVVVEDGEGYDALPVDLEGAFVVELPEFVGCGAFEGMGCGGGV
jgi:hypothetical protein